MGSDETKFQHLVSEMLRELDPEPDREGLVDTPRRVEKAFRYYCQGYQQDPVEAIGGLKKLLDAGALSQEEFDAKKTELLARM